MVSSTLARVKSLAIVSTVGLLAPLLATPQAKAASLFNKDLSQAAIQPFYTTTGNPENYIVAPGTTNEGVTNLFLDFGGGSTGFCTGGLLGTGVHILTAAHCLTDNGGNLNVYGGTANFGLSTGNVSLSIANFVVHENWTGDSYEGYDIAILELAQLAPNEAERYNIYRGSDEVGKISTKVGYGDSGNGNFGAVLPSGTKRAGQNIYDASGSIFDVTDALLVYDFDNGLAANDAFGYWFGSDYADLGLGLNEVNSAPGDSGGPTFINGAIAGITSFGVTFAEENFLGSDVDSTINSSFGEFSFDTRVSSYSSWIDGILNRWNGSNRSAYNSSAYNSSVGNPLAYNSSVRNASTSDRSESVPEPDTIAGLILLIAGLLLTRNKRPRRSIR